MKRIFIEVADFRRSIEDYDKTGAILRELQLAILGNPRVGVLIPGCGGIKKFRIGDPGRKKGKRGGFRVIYLDLEKREKTYLIAIYSKGIKEDLSSEEKKIIQKLVIQLKEEVQ